MKDLFSQSEFTNTINKLLSIEFKVKLTISRIHNLLNKEGNILFYVITDDNNKFLINIMGKKIQDDSILYWVENINTIGKIETIFYARDFFVICFARGEKYNNEFIFYTYQYGNQYPRVTFVDIEKKNEYLEYISLKYKKVDLTDIPEDIKMT